MPLLMQPRIRIQKTFADFVDITAAENDTRLLEYASLKSEPTALMSTPQLALFHGKSVESHIINTKDGYLLTMHRITPTSNILQKANQTIILHHGLLGSSADWILLGATNSLPYLLYNAGYDVWMTNARGNYYSRRHQWKNVDSEDYWQFSWQQMGEFDLAAVIDYIRQVKGFSQNNAHEKINYVGHSMGATALLVLLSTMPKYNNYLRIAILMAPLVYMTNVKGPLKIITDIASSSPEKLLKLTGVKEFVPTRRIPKWLALKYCKGSLLFCCNPLYFISGGISNVVGLSASFIARVMYHVPAGGSTITLLHYAQLVATDKFHRFNDTYNEFNLSNVILPIVLFSSDYDWIATIPDVLKLYFSIANPIDHYIIRSKNFSHTDFVWGQEANTLVFNKIFEYLEHGLDWIMLNTNDVHTDIV